MSYSFPAQVKVNPSFSEPDLVVQYAQASGFQMTMAGGNFRVRMSIDDLNVYFNSLNIKTGAQVAQFGANLLPSISLQANYETAQTYLLQNRNNYDNAMERAAARYNVSLPNAIELGQRQGIFQRLRTMHIYGFQPANNEGLLNTQGSTLITLPADSLNNTSFTKYSANDMYQFLLQQMVDAKQRMFQSGAGISNKIVFLSPQRVFLALQYSAIVQVTSYQRPGGGTNTVAGAIQKIAEEAGDNVTWAFDDTLIGKGAGGTDAVILCIPEVQVPTMPGGANTNIFGTLQPASNAVITQYTDVVAPIKTITPIPDGGYTQKLEMRATSGWTWRPQGLSIISMPY